MSENIHAFICGVEGTSLNAYEIDYLTRYRPLGVILFARNCDNPEQIKALTAQIKSCLNHPLAMILIDQEGGRVARLRPPHWRAYPPAAHFSDMALHSVADAKRATYLNARLIAEDLTQLGINVNCAPLADIPAPGSHDIIGNRAFGKLAPQVIELASAQSKGLHDGGVMTILKHIPGHGRATADSHEDLPVVEASLKTLEDADFIPFKALNTLPMAMTAHILYTALDTSRVATLSPIVIEYIRTQIGFDGLLMSDDISMKALKGDFSALSQGVWDAGCDIVLHCNGKREEMDAIASVVRPLAGKSLKRAEIAYNTPSRKADRVEDLLAELQTLSKDIYATA